MNWTLETAPDRLRIPNFLYPVSQILTIWMIALCLLGIVPERLLAAEVVINCADVNDANSCRLDSASTFSESTFEVVQNLLQVAQSNSASGICVQAQANTYNCNISGDPSVVVPLTCVVQGNSASCQYPSRPELLSVDCEQTGAAGQCILSSDPAALDGTLTQSGHGNLVSFDGVLLSGCAALSGSEGFRGDCSFLLDGFNNNEASLIATTRAVAPLNADTPIYSALNFIDHSLGHILKRLNFLRQVRLLPQSTEASSIRQGFDNNRPYDEIGGYQNFDRYSRNEYPFVSRDSGSLNAFPPTPAGLVETPLVDAAGFSRLGVFVDASILSAEATSQPDENGSDQAGGIITWGVDYRYSPDFTAGLAFSTSNSSVDYSAGRGDLSDLGFQLLAFGSYYNGSLYVDASIGAGGNQYDQSRVLRCGASDGCAFVFDQRAESSFSGSQFSFSLASGYDLKLLRALTVTPFAQVSSSSITIDAYRESVGFPDQPGAGFALELDEQSRTTTLLSVGIRGSYPISSGTLVSVPHASLEFVSAPNDEELTITGSFAGNQNQGERFAVSNRSVENSYALVSLGSVFQFRRGTSAFVSANILFGNSLSDKFQVTSGFRWEL